MCTLSCMLPTRAKIREIVGSACARSNNLQLLHVFCRAELIRPLITSRLSAQTFTRPRYLSRQICRLILNINQSMNQLGLLEIPALIIATYTAVRSWTKKARTRQPRHALYITVMYVALSIGSFTGALKFIAYYKISSFYARNARRCVFRYDQQVQNVQFGGNTIECAIHFSRSFVLYPASKSVEDYRRECRLCVWS